MAGRVVRRTTPRHLKATGGKRGWAVSDSSGLLRYADELIADVRQGRVSKQEADITPGFGTYHPQDLKNLGTLDDPTPIKHARPIPTDVTTLSDMGISDQEVQASVREGRPPRRGY